MATPRLFAYVVGFIGSTAHLLGVSLYRGVKEGKIETDDIGHQLKQGAEIRGYHPVVVLDLAGFAHLQKKHRTLRTSTF